MNKHKLKRVGKIIVKSLFTVLVVGAVGVLFLTGAMKTPENPLSHEDVTPHKSLVFEEFTTYTETITPEPPDLLKLIPDYVEIPEGGTSWNVFGGTKEHEYTYEEDEDFVYMGVRPEFSEDLKKLNGSTITIQGYMFPLEASEKQKLFLLGPFPASCPYHYHVPPKLIIEVHVKAPLAFSYDAVNIKGELELVSEDHEYNVFYRLKNAEIVL